MRLHLLGVRGSTPAPGAEFVRYGGHTSSVAVTAEGADRPTLVLDAGTGIRSLPRLLDGAAFEGALLLGHLHWDHTHGLPFSRAVDRDDARVDLFLPQPIDGTSAEDMLARSLGPPHFPIKPSGLRGRWTFAGIEPGTYRIDRFEVLALEIPHKGGRTFGYRVSDGQSTIAYLSDHGPSVLGDGPDGWGPYHDAALELADGVDLLLHDAQHTAEEFPAVAAFGHSPIDYAVELGRRAGVATVGLFHHDPNRTDDELDAIVDKVSSASASDVRVVAAAQDTDLVL